MIDLSCLKVGSYVSFDDEPIVLFKVLEIDYIHKYILVYDSCVDYKVWERFEYITKVFNFNGD